MTRRIRVRGIKREELNHEQLAFVFFQLGKQERQKRRERQAAERDKRVTKESRRGR